MEEAGVFLQLVIVDVASVWVHLWDVTETGGSGSILRHTGLALPLELEQAIKVR